MKIRVLHSALGTDGWTPEGELELLRSFAKPDTEFEIVRVQKGAATIESHYDVYLSSIDTFRLVKEAEETGCDGVIITCFGNAGLEPSRELVKIPVVAPGMAAWTLAITLAPRFSTIVTLPSVLYRHETEIRKLGLENHLASIRVVNINVADLRAKPGLLKERFLSEARKAIEEDGACVIIPGCGGMTGRAYEFQQELGVPVIEPLGAAVKLAETMVDLKVSHSKRVYATPPGKKRIM
jgi:allantoin racemase